MQTAKKKLLVTGGTGYIGSHTIISILEQGKYSVISADNYHNSSPEALDRIEAVTGQRVINYPIDLTDAHAVEALLRDHPDLAGIIHFAALKSVPESVEKPLLYYHNNLQSLIHLLEGADRHGIEHVVFSSSCSVYGNPVALPVREDTPFAAPESPYGATKQISEQIIQDFLRTNTRVRCVALRYFNPVGAHPSGKNGEDPRNVSTNLVPIIVEVAAGIREQMYVWGTDYPTRDGSCVRDYIHVMDVAEAHLRALDYLHARPSLRWEVFNLGSGTGITVLEAIRAFEQSTGVSLNYHLAQRRAGDVASVYADTQKAEELLGWQAQYSLHQMMQTAWAWKQHWLNTTAS